MKLKPARLVCTVIWTELVGVGVGVVAGVGVGLAVGFGVAAGVGVGVGEVPGPYSDWPPAMSSAVNM